MNLVTLFDYIQKSGQVKPSRIAHIRMSVKQYSAALGCPSLEKCTQDIYDLDQPTRNRIIEKHFDGKKSAYVLRNTKNDISFLFRLAEELKLLPEKEINNEDKNSIGKHKLGRTLPQKIPADKTGFHRAAYGFPISKWSEQLKNQYEDWKEWVSVERTIADKIKPFNRPTTIQNKTDKMEAYFGYLRNVKEITNPEFQMIIDLSLLKEFLEWQRERNGNKASSQAKSILSVAAGIAEKYFLPKAILDNDQSAIYYYGNIVAEINYLQRVLTKEIDSEKTKTSKNEKLIDAENIRVAARQEFPLSSLFENQSGTVLALNAGRAVAILMLVNYPLRNRNYREARLSKNIIKNADGKWMLRFTEDDKNAALKSQKRFKKNNVYEKVIDEETTDFLNKYLKDWRPLLTNQIEKKIAELYQAKQTDSESHISRLNEHKDFLFLNSKGVPFSAQGFTKWIEKGLYRWIGSRITPEDIRQISVIEMLKQYKNTSQIAEHLNDVPESINRLKHNLFK